jgi:hypothetical protein
LIEGRDLNQVAIRIVSSFPLDAKSSAYLSVALQELGAEQISDLEWHSNKEIDPNEFRAILLEKLSMGEHTHPGWDANSCIDKLLIGVLPGGRPAATHQ